MNNLELINELDRVNKEHISLLESRLRQLEKTILIQEEIIKTLKLLVETLSIKGK